MCVLPDHLILSKMGDGSLGIDEFHEGSLTPNGYDLRIAEVRDANGEIFKDGEVTIHPGSMFYVSTVETVRLPDDVCAQLWLRTTWIRRGILGAFGKIDAGFNGTLTLGAFNASQNPVKIPIGERFCQMVLESLHSPATRPYSERSGNYQGQKGVTLEPVRR